MWNLDIFKQLLEQTLTVLDINTEQSFDITITEVQVSPSQPEGWESFSVFMSCDACLGFQQGNLQLQHPDHGEVILFANANSATELEIIINAKV